MKKYVAWFLACALALSTTACGSAPSSSAPVSSSVPASESSSAPADAASDAPIEVDKGLINVKITLPADFLEAFGGGLDASAVAESMAQDNSDNRVKSVVVNDDGSVTMTISKADHKLMMDDFYTQIEATFAELKEQYPSIDDISVNDACTEFTIVTNDYEAFQSSFASVAEFSLFLQGAMYQAFNGTLDSPVVVNVVDTEGTIVETYSAANFSDNSVA